MDLDDFNKLLVINDEVHKPEKSNRHIWLQIFTHLYPLGDVFDLFIYIYIKPAQHLFNYQKYCNIKCNFYHPKKKE